MEQREEGGTARKIVVVENMLTVVVQEQSDEKKPCDGTDIVQSSGSVPNRTSNDDIIDSTIVVTGNKCGNTVCYANQGQNDVSRLRLLRFDENRVSVELQGSPDESEWFFQNMLNTQNYSFDQRKKVRTYYGIDSDSDTDAESSGHDEDFHK